MSKRTPGNWRVAPETCRYKIADERKVAECLKHGFSTEFDALAITEETQSKTLAIIPLDDSSIENAYLLAAAPEMLEALKLIQLMNVAGEFTETINKLIAKAE